MRRAIARPGLASQGTEFRVQSSERQRDRELCFVFLHFCGTNAARPTNELPQSQAAQRCAPTARLHRTPWISVRTDASE